MSNLAISLQEPSSPNGLLKRANELQFTILQALITKALPYLKPGFQLDSIDSNFELHARKINMAKFLLQAMTKDFFSSDCSGFSEKKLTEYLRAKIRPLQSTKDARDFIQVAQHITQEFKKLTPPNISFKVDMRPLLNELYKFGGELAVLKKQLAKRSGSKKISATGLLNQHSKIAVVNLGMEESHPNREQYTHSSAKDQIDHLIKNIHIACRELKEKRPLAMWLIGWQEYGVQGSEDHFLLPDEKKYFKKELAKISQQYPNLRILAGTVATERKFSGSKLLDKLQQTEQAYQDLHDQYTAQNGEEDNDECFVAHAGKVTQTLRELKNTQDDKKEVSIIRNTCYGFQDGEIIGRHDKIDPYEETYIQDQDRPEAVYQPAKGRNRPNIMKFTHPLTGELIEVGVEICYEHQRSRLQNEVRGRRRWPLFHTVLSATTNLEVGNVCGDYYIQFDSENHAQLLLPRKVEDLSRLPVELLEMNVLDDDPKLVKFMQPIYPFEKRVLNVLDKAVMKLGNGDRLASARKLMMEFRVKFVEFMCIETRKDSKKVYDWLTDKIKLLPTKIPFGLWFAETQATEKMIKQLCDDLTKLVDEERQKNPDKMDVFSKAVGMSL